MRVKGRRRLVFVISAIVLPVVLGLSCHECGHMYDGATFMGIQSFEECQFFEHDIAENGNKFMKECPEDEKCCFSLREHMAIEFWGHAAAAEVFVHGCCSSLNRTTHHLTTSTPPPLVTTNIYRAEIMSQTIQNGDIKTRVLFCNTLGCNNQRVPWSEPVMPVERQPRIQPDPVEVQPQEVVPTRNSRRHDDDVEVPSPNQGRGFPDDENILALLEPSRRNRLRSESSESARKGQGRAVEVANILAEILNSETEQEDLDKEDRERDAKEALLRELAAQMGLPNTLVPSTTRSTTTTTTDTTTTSTSTNEQVPSNTFVLGGQFVNQTRFVPSVQGSAGSPVCECQCSCPALICPTFHMPAHISAAQTNHPAISLLNIAIFLSLWVSLCQTF